MGDTLRKVGAWILFTIAAFMAIGFLASDKQNSIGVTIFAVLLTIVFPVAVGVVLLRGGLRGGMSARRALLRRQTIDAEILRLAIERQGRLTIIDVTSALALSAGEVQQSLDEMVRREAADMEITDDGVIVYVFHDAQHLKGIGESRGLLDA